MQFNSFAFILAFMPITAILYFLCNKVRDDLGKILLISAGALFYYLSGKECFFVLLLSIVINYCLCKIMGKKPGRCRALCAAVVTINVGLLLAFKYYNFAAGNINHFFGTNISLWDIFLPVGISFFTFQQIAYAVAVYNKSIIPNFVDYVLYISYFPKVLMGPLADPVDFINQINDKKLKRVNWENVACGIKIFSIGLFKKVMIADVFAKSVNWAFSNYDAVSSLDWLLVMLFYTFEIYFDFSGYSDMAAGASIILNIELPINFDSPYKSLSIRDFWKRWHMSLTGFFTKYIYIPLGGSRKGQIFTYVNTMIVFAVSGLWHGANFTFILWGLLHGLFMIFDRMFEKIEKKIPAPVRWLLSFGVVNVLWLLFRSDSIRQWLSILGKLIHIGGSSVSDAITQSFRLPEFEILERALHLNDFCLTHKGVEMLLYILITMVICLVPKNAFRRLRELSMWEMIAAALLFVWGIVCLSSESVFVYFGF